MSFYEIILWIAAIGLVIGGADHLMKNRFGLGSKLMEGFEMMRTLAVASAGIIVLAPVLAEWLQPLLLPVFRMPHADPAMFGSLIANDMGEYPLAMMLAENNEMGLMFGAITFSMLDATLVFILPVGMGVICKEDVPSFIRGMLLGIITIPVGSIVNGLAAGFDIGKVLVNHIPVLLSVLLAIGFALIPQKVVYAAAAVGRGLVCALANPMPPLNMLKNMDPRGKGINMAWLTCVQCVFGDHLGFTAGIAPDMTAPLIVGKLAGGACAMALPVWQTRKMADNQTIVH